MVSHTFLITSNYSSLEMTVKRTLINARSVGID
jgi:hypothetical protein